MLLGSATAASAATTAVTPGWECIPTTAGQAVVSGGDSASGPSCGSGATAVLAPTYVAAGIDGKPTVKFAAVNVQILDGSGATSTVNGTGNLVLGYDEDAGSQSGSHNLILGEDQTATSFADVIGGLANTVSGPYAAAFGEVNNVSGNGAFAAGDANIASGSVSSVTGGNNNVASGELSSISGGERNTASGTQSAVTGGEDNTAGEPLTSVFGGWANVANTGFGAVFGGCANAVGPTAATDPGCGNQLDNDTVVGGYDNRADGDLSFVAGGNRSQALGWNSTIIGGWENEVTAGGGSSMSQFGGAEHTLSSTADNASEVDGTPFTP
jgi:hypothetical protein